MCGMSGTCGHSALPRKEEGETELSEGGKTGILFYDVIYNENIQNFDSGKARKELEVVERKLDILEGAVELSGENDIAEILKDEAGLEYKLHNTLDENLEYWDETGISEFALA